MDIFHFLLEYSNYLKFPCGCLPASSRRHRLSLLQSTINCRYYNIGFPSPYVSLSPLKTSVTAHKITINTDQSKRLWDMGPKWGKKEVAAKRESLFYSHLWTKMDLEMSHFVTQLADPQQHFYDFYTQLSFYGVLKVRIRCLNSKYIKWQPAKQLFTVRSVMLEALVVKRSVVRMVVSSSGPGRQVGGGGGCGRCCRCRCMVMVVVSRIGAEATRSCQFVSTTKNPVFLSNSDEKDKR